ncbi:glycine oxidase ThiO [Rhodococcoides corynebacterioides]|uniref:glycine oxidase ThiO n=1 Tax=Rhodococcoides corynebacterioides TaxID=53972 RepID=UPI0027DF7718|nr:glycine oxidase ThiO [Rhodococcus corynebacterioides]
MTSHQAPPPTTDGRPSVAVVGAGVVGLFAARAAALAGHPVRVIDRGEPGRPDGASWVAGGMLAPFSEGWPGEDDLLALGAASLGRWRAVAPELGEHVVTARGTLTVAFDSADVADLTTVAEWVGARGHEVEMLGRPALRALEPGVGGRAALSCPTELAVDNRALLTALVASCRALGVRFTTDAVADLEALPEDRVVVAAGWASSALLPGVSVRPVKGEILRLRRRAGSVPPPQRTVRATVNGRAVYLVPRADGLVVGATQYEHGDDTAVTVAGVRDLLADAERVLPGIADYEFVEAAAGLRPGSPDNLPMIGPVDERTIVAAGHGRNGVLLAPITADAVVAALRGDVLPEAACCSPTRRSGSDRPQNLSRTGAHP